MVRLWQGRKLFPRRSHYLFHHTLEFDAGQHHKMAAPPALHAKVHAGAGNLPQGTAAGMGFAHFDNIPYIKFYWHKNHPIYEREFILS